jgi:LacI family transcriptional regulator
MGIFEVARRANVSTATVSRTINNPDLVDPNTAAKVQRAIQDLNYVPDTHARTLVSGKSRILGLIVSDITNPFFPELIKGFNSAAVQRGYDILVGSTDYSSERMELCVRRMMERKVDGVAIMTSERDEPVINQLSRQRIPIAFLDLGPTGRHFGSVRVDYAGGIAEAVDHLINLGHESFAFISGPANLPSAQIRLTAFLDDVAAKKNPALRALALPGDFTLDGGYSAMRTLLTGSNIPTAVIGGNDLSAIGALRAIHRAGLKVPRDISIIGFDDIHLAEFTEPPLTTIRLPRDEMARRVVSWLIAEIEDPQTSADLGEPLETKLVLRESTDWARSTSVFPLRELNIPARPAIG